MSSKPRSRQAVLIARGFLLGCSLAFAFAVQNQVSWILIPSAIVLWSIVVIGYANMLIWIFKDGLVALAKKSLARKVGWIPFIASSITIVMTWRQGWVVLSVLWAILLLCGFLLRVVAREKLSSIEVVR